MPVKVFLCTVLAALLAAAQVPGAQAGPDAAERTQNQYVLGPDDTLLIQVRDAAEIGKQPVRIDGRGEIQLPLAGTLRAAGRSPAELSKEIAARIRHLVRNPEVVVTIQEQRSQPVSVLGSVRSPGVIQAPSEKSLIEILAMAGGLKEDAGSSLKITRRADGRTPLPRARLDTTGKYYITEISVASILQARNPEDNVIIEPHDVITVPAAPMIYVVGYVKKPGAFLMKEEEQMSALLAL